MYLQSLKAGLLYFLVVFVAGCALGALRILVVAPHIGELWATLIEVPIILAVSWFAASWAVRMFLLWDEPDPRFLMGAVALALLLVAELLLSILALHRSVEEHFMAYLSLPGAIGLAAQLLYALIPAIQRWVRRA